MSTTEVTWHRIGKGIHQNADGLYRIYKISPIEWHLVQVGGPGGSRIIARTSRLTDAKEIAATKKA